MKNVWIVDDDRSIRWVLEKALQKADIPCKTFSEAESVLQAIKKEQPALILSDIHMPGKSLTQRRFSGTHIAGKEDTNHK